VRLGDRLGSALAALASARVVVRDVSKSPGLGGCVRITVGTPDEDDRLVEALRGVFA
jgi:histidinol-phosphate aminotransferase